MLTNAQLTQNLKDMQSDLKVVKSAAQYFLNKITHYSTDDVMNSGGGSMSPEDSSAMSPAMTGDDSGASPSGGNDMGAPTGDNMGEGQKPPKIETPEEAKTTLHDAINDLKGVVKGIDNITDQAGDVAEKTSSKTFRLSSNIKEEITQLTKQAIAAIEDGKSAIKHWAFLLKVSPNGKSALSDKGITLRQAAQVVKEAKEVVGEMHQTFGTAVAPTGAEFSGDKTLSKRPEAVENNTWHKGFDEFESNKAKEDKIPNAASEPRLTDEGNPHEFGAYVNAKSVAKNDKFSSALVIRTLDQTGKNGKYAVVTWDKLNNNVGPKNSENYTKFVSPAFAKAVEDHVKKSGLESVASYLNADVDGIGIAKVAREPKVEDKAKLRAYYADAFGDAEFAKELTSNQKTAVDLAMGINQDKASNVTKGGDDMNIGYKPDKDSANDEPGGLDGGDKSNSLGTGKGEAKASLSVEERQAKARVAVDFARLAASRNVIPFTKTAIKTKALEVVAYSEEKFNAQKELLESMPLSNEAALKEARIPEDGEVEKGIVANKTEAVRSPENKMPAEGLNSDVKSDAAIKKASQMTAAIVPQLQKESALTKESFVNKLDTFQNRMARRGINPEELTTDKGTPLKVKAHYRKHNA